MKLPTLEALPAANADGQHDVGVLRDWFAEEAQRIAQKFDARNGTRAYQKEIENVPELLKLATN